MSSNPIDYIRSRSREEWLSLAKEKWIDGRIFIQENGELSLVIGFALGLLVVLFFRLFLGIFVIMSLLGIIAWNIAEPESSIIRRSDILPPIDLTPDLSEADVTLESADSGPESGGPKII